MHTSLVQCRLVELALDNLRYRVRYPKSLYDNGHQDIGQLRVSPFLGEGFPICLIVRCGTIADEIFEMSDLKNGHDQLQKLELHLFI